MKIYARGIITNAAGELLLVRANTEGDQLEAELQLPTVLVGEFDAPLIKLQRSVKELLNCETEDFIVENMRTVQNKTGVEYLIYMQYTKENSAELFYDKEDFPKEFQHLLPIKK